MRLVRFPVSRILRVTLLAIATSLLGGCATLFQPDPCRSFKADSADLNKDTVYTLAPAESKIAARDFRSLPEGHLAAARMYRVWVDQSKITPCQLLAIKSSVYLQRTDRQLWFEEVREFYTKDGYKITENKSELSRSLGRTGYYLGQAPLPIPQAAPPGTYRIVSKLYFRTSPKRRAILLAEASTEFKVGKLN